MMAHCRKFSLNIGAKSLYSPENEAGINKRGLFSNFARFDVMRANLAQKYALAEDDVDLNMDSRLKTVLLFDRESYFIHSLLFVSPFSVKQLKTIAITLLRDFPCIIVTTDASLIFSLFLLGIDEFVERDLVSTL